MSPSTPTLDASEQALAERHALVRSIRTDQEAAIVLAIEAPAHVEIA